MLGPDCRVGVDIASIEEAVSRSECVTISLPSGTFEISDIPINRTVRILGKGSTPTILDANFESRHFTIEDGEYLHIEHVVLRNGSADIGGSILGKSNAEINILDSEIVNNRASHEGGAIAFPSGGTIDIENSVIENNKVESIGAHAIKGGAISITNGDLSIDNTRFTNNGLQSHITETPRSRFQRERIAEGRSIVDPPEAQSRSISAIQNLTATGSLKQTKLR